MCGEGERDVLCRGETLVPGCVCLDAIVVRLNITPSHHNTSEHDHQHTRSIAAKKVKKPTGDPIFVKIVNSSPYMIAIPSGSVVSTCAGVFAQSVWLVR